MSDKQRDPKDLEAAQSLILLSLSERPAQPSSSTATTALATATVPAQQSQRARNAQSGKKKNAPICPGAKFTWSDNTHIDRASMRVGKVEKSKLQMSLKATDGRWHTFEYLRKDEVDWDSKASVLLANTWRWQIFRRRLNKPDESTTIRRHRWTAAEVQVLQSNASLLRRPSSMTAQQWADLAALLPNREKKSIISKFAKLRLGSQANNSEQVDHDSEDDEEDEMEEELEDKHGGDLEHGLEDDSDDEFDGMRPSAQPVGGVLISAN
ncbi:hypothetical protein M430DRAFT_185155 [Amorphotheca resinae ATCC 22711]|jgi:hypothetical protein|uniref:Myb-like domain-containing protein n=1 Tax=Amorphotheca resinae ATCC 22711 TaxID=857342 RepID=A0A2T3ASE7_AMORE|nr:hypothetical protein M430DRAFT_185155 [Amorphotheca resinae ATCC 22711]PSS09286.1 hypothetical protein M430DRAFT_185155 [Amorphotheca resinae ATCC 22711]